MTHKDLDALLWDWAADILNSHDSGFPSSYELKQRVDAGTVFVPNYFPHPKIAKLNMEIGLLEPQQKNIICFKYLYNMKIPEIARQCDCHQATIYRKINDARANLLDSMRNFATINRKMN